MNVTSLPPEAAEQIVKIIRHGGDAEVKKINGNVVVIEVERKVRSKTAITG